LKTNEVVIRLSGEGLRTEVTAGKHTVIADEPASVGGTDAGPTPYDLLAAALGSCTAMTIRIVADRRGWPLEGVAIGLRHSRVHEKDCENCEENKVGIDQFERWITLSGALTEEQRMGLMRIADRCPVGQTLARGVRIVHVAPPAAEAEGRNS
jgi:putative redox protein